jgi:hypothetical protein
MIAALLALQALALYVIWWVVMIVVSCVPMVGKRHRGTGTGSGSG